MANLSQYSDPAELDNKYIGKIVVYVEGKGDANLFNMLIGPGHGERIEFKIPPEGGTGCGPTTARVKMERVTNRKVFGLVDGEAAISVPDGFERILSCTEPTFQVDDPEMDGMLFLAEHEVENILLRHADICGYIVRNTTLAGMHSRTATDVRQAINAIVVHYFSAAVCKYTSARLHTAKAISGILDTGIFFNDKPRREFYDLLKDKVETAGCSWPDFKKELKVLLRLIKARFATLEDALKSEERKRLADGKSVLKKITNKYNIDKRWEGHLAEELSKVPYAVSFREHIFAKTSV